MNVNDFLNAGYENREDADADRARCAHFLRKQFADEYGVRFVVYVAVRAVNGAPGGFGADMRAVIPRPYGHEYAVLEIHNVSDIRNAELFFIDTWEFYGGAYASTDRDG